MPPVVVFEGMGDNVSLVCIDIIAHACKQGVDTFGVKLVSQYHDVFKGLLPMNLGNRVPWAWLKASVPGAILSIWTSLYGSMVQGGMGEVCRSFPLCENVVAGDSCKQEAEMVMGVMLLAGSACTLPTKEYDDGVTWKGPVLC